MSAANSLFNEADAAAEVKCSKGDALIYISAYVSIHLYISERSQGHWCSSIKLII